MFLYFIALKDIQQNYPAVEDKASSNYNNQHLLNNTVCQALC